MASHESKKYESKSYDLFKNLEFLSIKESELTTKISSLENDFKKLD